MNVSVALMGAGSLGAAAPLDKGGEEKKGTVPVSVEVEFGADKKVASLVVMGAEVTSLLSVHGPGIETGIPGSRRGPIVMGDAAVYTERTLNLSNGLITWQKKPVNPKLPLGPGSVGTGGFAAYRDTGEDGHKVFLAVAREMIDGLKAYRKAHAKTLPPQEKAKLAEAERQLEAYYKESILYRGFQGKEFRGPSKTEVIDGVTIATRGSDITVSFNPGTNYGEAYIHIIDSEVSLGFGRRTSDKPADSKLITYDGKSGTIKITFVTSRRGHNGLVPAAGTGHEYKQGDFDYAMGKTIYEDTLAELMSRLPQGVKERLQGKLQ